MNKWRKNKGKFEKVNGPLLDRLFDWWDGTTSGEFTTARLRMTARGFRPLTGILFFNSPSEKPCHS